MMKVVVCVIEIGHFGWGVGSCTDSVVSGLVEHQLASVGLPGCESWANLLSSPRWRSSRDETQIEWWMMICLQEFGLLSSCGHVTMGTYSLPCGNSHSGVTLITKGNITIEVITQSKANHKKLIFEQDFSDIKGQTNFSDKCWGKVTHEYVHSVNSLLKVSKERLFAEARQIMKCMTSRHDRDQLDTSATAHKEASLGSCTILMDIT